MSDFWVRKMKTYFRRFDFNNDGIFSTEDVELMVERFAENVDDDDRINLLRKRLHRYFSSYAKDWNGRMTEETMTNTMKKIRDDPDFAEACKEVAEICVQLLDTDGDGFVEEGEYVRLFYNFSINDRENLAKLAFRSLDTNHDGKVSIEEFRNGFLDFQLSDDETGPGVNIFGPLLGCNADS